MSRRSTLALVAILPAVAGCGAGTSDVRPAAATEGRNLERNGISIAVPGGWDGRVLFREPTGTTGAVFQVASFELPAQEGLEPPPRGPDRIKEMRDGDVLITMLTDEAEGRPVDGAPRLADLTFLPRGAPRIPHGHALAEGSVCLATRCLAISVDFGAAAPDPALLEHVDGVLRSLAVDGRALELDGLRLELPPGWHGYATTVGTDASQPVLWAANVRFAEAPPQPDFPGATLRALPSAAVVVQAVAAPADGPRSSAPFTDGEVRQLDLPLTVADGTFFGRDYEGQPARHVSTVLIDGRVGRRSLFVQVYFGRNEPTGAMREAADAVLASVSL